MVWIGVGATGMARLKVAGLPVKLSTTFWSRSEAHNPLFGEKSPVRLVVVNSVMFWTFFASNDGLTGKLVTVVSLLMVYPVLPLASTVKALGPTPIGCAAIMSSPE